MGTRILESPDEADTEIRVSDDLGDQAVNHHFLELGAGGFAREPVYETCECDVFHEEEKAVATTPEALKM